MVDTEQEICKNILDRQKLGLKKYGRTVADNPLTERQWLQHLFEELLDGAIYCKRLIQQMDSAPIDPRFANIDYDKLNKELVDMRDQIARLQTALDDKSEKQEGTYWHA